MYFLHGADIAADPYTGVDDVRVPLPAGGTARGGGPYVVCTRDGRTGTPVPAPPG